MMSIGLARFWATYYWGIWGINVFQLLTTVGCIDIARTCTGTGIYLQGFATLLWKLEAEL